MFDDIIADVQGVQISGRGSLEPALHSCPALSCVPPEPFIPPCQLCQTVSSRNSLKLTLISSASLPIPAQIERGKTLPPTFQSHYHQPFGRPHRPSHFAKAELQASYAQCFFCLSPSMSPSFTAAPSPCSGQVGRHKQFPPTPHPSPPVPATAVVAAAGATAAAATVADRGGSTPRSRVDRTKSTHTGATQVGGGRAKLGCTTHIHVTPTPTLLPPVHTICRLLPAQGDRNGRCSQSLTVKGRAGVGKRRERQQRRKGDKPSSFSNQSQVLGYP